jgi:hypothetical protein
MAKPGTRSKSRYTRKRETVTSSSTNAADVPRKPMGKATSGSGAARQAERPSRFRDHPSRAVNEGAHANHARDEDGAGDSFVVKSDKPMTGFLYSPCKKGTVGGDISGTLASMPFSFVVGHNYRLAAGFDLLVQCRGTCDGDFLDPTLTDIEITDASTGLTVHGISVTGDDGTVYPVNTQVAVEFPVNCRVLRPFITALDDVAL